MKQIKAKFTTPKNNPKLQVVSLLKEKGLSNTPVRRSLIEILRGASKPLSVQDLSAKLSLKLKSPPDLTTLYRNMDHLEKARILTRVDMQGKADHFELVREHHHHHVYCRECESITCVPVCIPPALVKQISRLGFRNVQHQLQFSAICQQCAK